MAKIDFRTKDQDFYKKFYRKSIEGQSQYNNPRFRVPVISSKQVKNPIYRTKGPHIKCLQSGVISCCFSGLVSDLDYVE